MNVRGGSARQLASRIAWAQPPICKFCLHDLTLRRGLATAATAAATNANVESSIGSNEAPTTASSPVSAYQIRAGLVLSRPPQITRDLHPFEKAFFLYQRRLNERLALPFTRYFYFKKDTPADLEWKRKARLRSTPARDIGMYNAYGEDGWNDELLVGAPESEPIHQVEALLKDSEAPGAGASAGLEGEVANEAATQQVEPVERPMPRITEADKKGDKKSLDRLLQRTLYLLVKNKDGSWSFPDDRLGAKESLHQATERIIVHSGGVNMNTWVIGNAPIGHFNYDFSTPIQTTQTYPQRPKEHIQIQELGKKIFFMKARIMAGQANLIENKLGLQDFQWLSKEEIGKLVKPGYWKAVKHMLAER